MWSSKEETDLCRAAQGVCQFEGYQALLAHCQVESQLKVLPQTERITKVARGAWSKASSAKSTPFHRWLGDGHGRAEAQGREGAVVKGTHHWVSRQVKPQPGVQGRVHSRTGRCGLFLSVTAQGSTLSLSKWTQGWSCIISLVSVWHSNLSKCWLNEWMRHISIYAITCSLKMKIHLCDHRQLPNLLWPSSLITKMSCSVRSLPLWIFSESMTFSKLKVNFSSTKMKHNCPIL